MAVPLAPGTAVLDERVSLHHVKARRFESVEGSSFSVLRALPDGIMTDIRSTRNYRVWKGFSSRFLDGVDVTPIRSTQLIQTPAVTQVAVRMPCHALSVSYFSPQPRMAACHGIPRTFGTAELATCKNSDVVAAKFFQIDSRLPKNTVRGSSELNALKQLRLSVRPVSSTYRLFMY